MKHFTWLSVLGLLVVTLVPVSQQIADGHGGNFLPMLKTLLLYYGLFDHCGHAVEGHVNMDKTDGKGLVNKREDTEESSPRRKTYQIRTPVEGPLWAMECTWDRDVMQRLGQTQQSSLFTCHAPKDLEDPVRVRLYYHKTCIMYLAYDTTCCSLEVPKEKTWQTFVFGESKDYPIILGRISENRDECIWELNVVRCEQS